jgi:rod shape-determining protein MreC
MQQIVNFIIKYKYFLFFLLLEIIAITFTIQSHSFHKSKFVNSANYFTGTILSRINSVKEYSNLKIYNENLLEENTRLKNLLSLQLRDTTLQSREVVDTVKYSQIFKFTEAKVIKNQFDKRYNYLTINKGLKKGIQPDQGVINSKGIIGITNTVSNNYATVLSILNENSKINVKLLNNLHFGTLEWDGKNYNKLQLVDLPIQANINIGDTVITGGRSTIFPEGIPVGTVFNFSKKDNSYKKIDIQLFNDMSAIGPVIIITNLNKKEIKLLEATTNNE